MASTGKSYSLQAISGNLDYTKARYLLDRCTFGAKKAEVDSLVGKDIASSLDLLLQNLAEPSPPLSYDAADLDVAVGETWINATYNGTYNSYRIKSLRAWWIELMMQRGVSLIEKMTLFWHNHFVTESDTVVYATMLYQYTQLLRKYALGNVKQLVYEMTINPAMLIYLNGESNKASAPNENYGRELLELFTIGKGPLIGEGNYTNYTESDIKEAAKVLTGWKVNRTNYTSSYDTTRHDKTTKVFSDAFGKTNISNKESDEYKLLVDMIFAKKETARFLTRKIYRWLMYYEIDQNVEQQIIEPLATILYDGNYEIKPVLAKLLSSEHFFSSDYVGAQIKNPFDFTIGMFRKCEVPLSSSFQINYDFFYEIYNSCRSMEMALGDPPDVAGWPQYYKEPAFYQLWINSATIPIRTSFTDTYAGAGITKSGFKYIIDPFVLTAQVTNPSDVKALITGLAQIILPVPLSNEQIQLLRDALIPGLADTTWTAEWSKYVTNPSDTAQKTAVGNKLKALIKAILRMPEYYLN